MLRGLRRERPDPLRVQPDRQVPDRPRMDRHPDSQIADLRTVRVREPEPHVRPTPEAHSARQMQARTARRARMPAGQRVPALTTEAVRDSDRMPARQEPARPRPDAVTTALARAAAREPVRVRHRPAEAPMPLPPRWASQIKTRGVSGKETTKIIKRISTRPHLRTDADRIRTGQSREAQKQAQGLQSL